MKKFLSLFISTVIVLTPLLSMPFSVWAQGEGSLGSIENSTVESELSEVQSSKFNASSKIVSAAEVIKNAMVVRDETAVFDYSSSVISESSLEDTVWEIFYYAISDEFSSSCVDGDYIAWHWSSVDASYEYYDDEDRYEITLCFDYRADDEDEYEVYEAVQDYLSGIDMSSVSDYELLKDFHDYILEICDYNDDLSPDYNYTSHGVFVEGSAVCQGYALAFYRLCKEVGFSVRYVNSDPNKGCHAWNLVYIGDAYYYVDCTWDDEYSDKYTLFLVDYTTLQSGDSYYNEHKLYSDEYDNDYFNTAYKKYISSTSYDSEAYSISNCVINVDYDDPYSTTVTDSLGNELVNGTDYTLSVTADSYVKVTGLGDYKNTYSKRKLDVNNTQSYIDFETADYNSVTGAPNAYMDNLTLDTDYIVSYPSSCDAGVYYAIIQGIGKYSGVIYKKYEITACDINTLGVALSYTSTAYNGKAQMPSVVFTLANGDVEYESDGSAQTLPGTYTVTVTGVGNYSGTAVLEYQITKGDVASYDMSLSVTNYVYDGSEKKPAVTVSSLTSGKDYTVTYSDNTLPGIAYATVSGIGNYQGSVRLEYYIQPKLTRVQIDSKNSSSVSLSWSAIDGVSGYIVEMLSNGAWAEVMNVDSSETSATVSGLSSYTTYRFRIKSYVIKNGETIYSEQSNEVSALTDYLSASSLSDSDASSSASSSSKKPAKAVIKKLKASKKSFTVKWKKQSVSGYQIQYSTSSSFKNAKKVTVKGASNTSKKIKKLKKGKKYYVRVRAYKIVNGKKIYGKWSTKKSVIVK